MGLREFSMQPAALLEVREQVRGLHAGRLTEAVARAFETPDRIDPALLLEQLGIAH